jgi:hypothetical protein
MHEKIPQGHISGSFASEKGRIVTEEKYFLFYMPMCC